MNKQLNYLTESGKMRSWLLTTDHKRIAIVYMLAITFFFFIGGAAALMFRLELFTPSGDLLSADSYNKMFSLHDIIMVWFFLVPAVPTVLGNFLVPLMIGARDLAFPRLNLASWYIFMLGGLFTLAMIVIGGVDTGWTFYTPYSSTYSNTYVILAATGIFFSVVRLAAGAGFLWLAILIVIILADYRTRGWKETPDQHLQYIQRFDTFDQVEARRGRDTT